MTISAATELFLTDVEKFAGKKFRYRPEIGMLIDAAATPQGKMIFDEIIFYAKFLSHARDILTRSGLDSDETKKLAQEFSSKIEVTVGLVSSLVERVQEDHQHLFRNKFLVMSEAGMREYIELMKELSWIKNYRLDMGQPEGGA